MERRAKIMRFLAPWIFLMASRGNGESLLFTERLNVPPSPRSLTASSQQSIQCFKFSSADLEEWQSKHHSINYWHVTFGIFLPLIVELSESVPFAKFEHDPQTKMVNTMLSLDFGSNEEDFIIRMMLNQCLVLTRLFQQNVIVKYISSEQKLLQNYCNQSFTVKRCDIPSSGGHGSSINVPVPRTGEGGERNFMSRSSNKDSSSNITSSNATSKKYLSYFDACKKEDAFIKFREYLALLTPNTWGMKATVQHQLSTSKRVLFVLRKCEKEAGDDGSAVHVHHSICFHESEKFREIEQGFVKRGYSTYSTYFDGITVEAQSELFADATIIIVPHGAEIANALYVRSATLFVELTPYFIGMDHLSLLQLQHKQVLLPKRNMLQSLACHFWSKKVYTRHMALPSLPPNKTLATSSPLYDVDCSDWTCYSPDIFVRYVVNEFRRLEVDLHHIGRHSHHHQA
jgi:hypothetical protein